MAMRGNARYMFAGFGTHPNVNPEAGQLCMEREATWKLPFPLELLPKGARKPSCTENAGLRPFLLC